jgi:cation diffusion facilitator family transporter
MSAAHEHGGLDHSSPARYGASRRVTLTNLAANLALTVTQVIVGIVGHSQALVADGLHTLADMVSDVFVLFALKHGHKGADADHPYGHARIETAATMVLGGILVAVGAGIAVRAGLRVFATDTFVAPSALTLWVALFTLLAKELMYRYTLRVAERFGSDMLRASAWHHRSDAASSLIVAAGIGGSLAGFAYLDALAAIAVAAMVIKVGIGLAWQSLRELVDTGLEPHEVEAIRRTIESVGGVKALHMLRTRRVGGAALVDVHVLVDDRLSVSEGHQISEAVRAKLLREVGHVRDALVHIDTEEDVAAATCAHLPMRDEVLARLDGYFRDIPEARHIERTTLHYSSSSGIEVELLLPLTVVAGPREAGHLGERFASAAKADSAIRRVVLSFR